MRRAGLFRHTIKDLRFITVILFVSITTLICAYTRASSHASSHESPGAEAAQQRRQNPRPQTRRRAPASPRPRVDYSKFSHATKGHFENCASCHQITSFAQPDIRDYPDHPSCIECHRQQFFRGARPVICSNCHTVTAPKSDVRFKFPKADAPTQFADIFPHANHIKTTSLLQFKKVVGEKVNIQATCTYCHKVDGAAQKPLAGAPKDAFIAPAGTFMTTPTSHVTCFQCHWQKGVENREQEPLSNECSRCHQNLAKPLIQTAALNTTLSAPATPQSRAQSNASVPKLIPASLPGTLAAHSTLTTPPRISPKFVHELDPHKKRANEEGKEVAITCTQCHAGVRKAVTLEAMRLKVNQVQLLPSCSTSACHTALSGTVGLKLSVFRELRERGKDAKFDCALCHAPPLSVNAEVPCSHYKAVLESAKKENEALEKAGKKARSLAGIEGLIPPRCADAPKKEGN
ncbi:MAG TPA: cytochrome c3 family protein [Pyrinomonadaceae bacterium]|nr:cytochrome c3 family protein [Pyrinomonadaceae bacterium]